MIEPLLILTEKVDSLAEYQIRGGGEGLAAALRKTPEQVTAEISHAGLRERDGFGTQVGRNWATMRPVRRLMSDATGFTDRWIIRRNPYQVIEGTAIAAHATGAERALIMVSAACESERAALIRARHELADRGRLGPVPIDIVTGRSGTRHNNPETLANIPPILRRGAEWFRDTGTPESPGALVFRISGDVRRPGVYELPLGLSLAALIYLVGGGPRAGRLIKAVVPGCGAALLPADRFDTPLDFDMMRAAGSALGRGEFIAYDDDACMVAVARKFATGPTAAALARIEHGTGTPSDVAGLAKAGPLVRSAVLAFRAEFDDHLRGGCPQAARTSPNR